MRETIDLNEQLNRYGITARGQIAQGRSLSEYAGYAAAMGAGLAMAGGADAAIIYSGVQNISAQINPGFRATHLGTSITSAGQGIDLNGGGNDINIQAVMGGQVNSFNSFKYIGAAMLNVAGGAKFLGTGSFAANLAAGALIGPAGVFNAGNAGRGKIAASGGAGYGSLLFGGIADGVSGFAGIQLGNGDYGWIRLRVDELGLNQPFDFLLGAPAAGGQGYFDKITVIDWAVETSGAGIRAGNTTNPSPVPEPSSLALLAAGAAGLASLRRRKARQAA